MTKVKPNSPEAGATALASYEGKDVQELLTILQEKDAALAKLSDELAASEEIIATQQETILGYEAEIAEKAERLALQDERINKVLGVLKVRGKLYRPLRRIAKLIGRTIIFAEELKKVRKDAVLFKDLPVDQQFAIISEYPHIFKEVDEKNSVTA